MTTKERERRICRVCQRIWGMSGWVRGKIKFRQTYIIHRHTLKWPSDDHVWLHVCMRTLDPETLSKLWPLSRTGFIKGGKTAILLHLNKNVSAVTENTYRLSQLLEKKSNYHGMQWVRQLTTSTLPNDQISKLGVKVDKGLSTKFSSNILKVLKSGKI